MGTILLIILILLLIGVLPAWPYSSGWGYWPSGGLGLIALILLNPCFDRPPLSRSKPRSNKTARCPAIRLRGETFADRRLKIAWVG